MTRPVDAGDARDGIRVLHVCETLPGGPASYLSEILADQVERLGQHNVAVLVPAEHRDHLPSTYQGRVFLFDRPGRNLRSLLSLGRALAAAEAAFAPDIVHLHSSFAGVIGRLHAYRTKPKIVYCAHCWSIDPGRGSRFKAFLAAFERLLALRADAIVNISPHERDFLLDLGFPAHKFVEIVSGIADQAPAPSSRLEPMDASGPIRLLFVGRMDRQKGIDLLLREIDDPALHATARLTVVGDKVVGRSLASHLPDNVVFTGWVSRDRIPDYIEAADAVVMPSRWEGMPLTALEAMRAGRALIASNMGPFPHIIEDGVTGLLVDTSTPGFLAEALKGRDRRSLREMGEAGRRRFLARFTSGGMNEELLSLYASLSARWRPTPGEAA